MANVLSRLGVFSARHRWGVILTWLVILGISVGAFLLTGGSLASSLDIPGTETARVTKQLDSEIPATSGGTGTVVFRTTNGSKLDAAQRVRIGDVLSDVAKVDGVASTVDPFSTDAARAKQEQQVADGTSRLAAARQQLQAAQQQPGIPSEQLAASAAELQRQGDQLDAARRLLAASTELRMTSTDGSTALGIVQFRETLFDLPAPVKADVAAMLDAARVPGVAVDYSTEIANANGNVVGPGEIAGLLIAAVVLFIVLGSLLPAVLPLISSLVGVGVGVAGSLAFGGIVDMTSITPVLGVMLGVAVGIDYSLFISNRHRRQLREGMAVAESIGLANGTSGSAVVFAGSTVIVALIALLVTGIPFLAVMGIVGAACVLVAVLVSVTLTPAMLGLLGMRMLSRRARARLGHGNTAPAAPKGAPTWRAVLTGVLAIAALLVVAIPALSMRLGLPDGSAEAQSSTQYRSYEAVAHEFGAGRNGTLLVTAALPKPVSAQQLTLTEADIADRLMTQGSVVGAAPIGASDRRDFIAFQVVPRDGPTSASTEQLVHDLRSLSLGHGVEVGVAGEASGNVDISEKLAGVLPLYLLVVVGLSLLIMMIVFRSLLVPLMATAGFVLSFVAALGTVTAVYQWGWLDFLFGVHDPGPVLNFAPLLVMGVLFGLAMDYQLFLVSGMREAYVHGASARTAVASGLRGGRAVVTAAAIIMVAVFGGFVFSDIASVKPLGFGLAAGVLLDAFLVRMLLIPALMTLAGPAAWWLPRWLDRILPNVDIEGAALERTPAVSPQILTEPERATQV